jgi:hypothetical protein
MKIEFIARVWEISGAYEVNIPKKIVKLFKIKKNQYYKVTLEPIKNDQNK